MKSWAKVFCLVLAVALGVSAGHGWGTATHVYFANYLGMRAGGMNMNEMYGAALPDFLGTQFVYEKQVVDYALHTNKQLMYTLYSFPQSVESRAVFFGFLTHNNNEDLKGADWYAHGVYPGDEKGWVIRQGVALAQDPEVYAYVVQLVGPEFAAMVGPMFGHTLIESAVDILVRRNLDPVVGARLVQAARTRSDEAAAILTTVLTQMAGDLKFAEDEAAYRESMIQYGQLFLLPEDQLIPLLAGETATLAEEYVKFMSGGELIVSVDPVMIDKFIRKAIAQVAQIYQGEVLATLKRVEANMKSYNLFPPYPMLALNGRGEVGKQGEESETTVGALPTSYTLGQNYPNPFNPSTTISYALPGDVPVTLKIYNSIGQEVATLIDGLQAAGIHRAVWDAKNIPSGVYVYRLTAGTFVETKKMMLMK